MKGIVLAGGTGSRLYPMTRVMNKQLLPIYDKPMIYYPLSTLMEAGINEIAIITDDANMPFYQHLLGDGRMYGCQFKYIYQFEPKGLAEAYILAEEWLDGEPSCMILGDNIFYGNLGLYGDIRSFKTGGKIFGYQVKDPERYGVIEFNKDNKPCRVIEKPVNPPSDLAIPGIYIFDEKAPELAKHVFPSGRGELEITEIIQAYMDAGRLEVGLLPRGVAWLDTGTPESLQDASQFISTIEARQNQKIACLEEIALKMGYITKEELKIIINQMPSSHWREYLVKVEMEQYGYRR